MSGLAAQTTHLSTHHGKVASLDAYVRHVRAVQQVWDAYWGEKLKRRWADSRFSGLVLKDKVLRANFAQMRKDGNGHVVPNTVFAIGDAHFAATGRGERGGAPGVKHLKQLCGEFRHPVVRVDEYRTTQRCFDCHARMRDVWEQGWVLPREVPGENGGPPVIHPPDPAYAAKPSQQLLLDAVPEQLREEAEGAWQAGIGGQPPPVGDVRRPVRGLKYCPSSNCGFKDRDLNAAKNILRKAVTPVAQRDSLLYLSRPFRTWEQKNFFFCDPTCAPPVECASCEVNRWFAQTPFFLKLVYGEELQAPYVAAVAAMGLAGQGPPGGWGG